MYATEVEAVVISPTEVYIDFEPIPMNQILGEDMGCKVSCIYQYSLKSVLLGHENDVIQVYVCEQQTISSTCFLERTPPRSGEALFSNLERGGVIGLLLSPAPPISFIIIQGHFMQQLYALRKAEMVLQVLG